VSRRKNVPLVALAGAGDDVTITVMRNGVLVHVIAPRRVVADAMALLPRMAEMLEGGHAPSEPPLRLVKGGAT
jgi:hypothetical protein